MSNRRSPRSLRLFLPLFGTVLEFAGVDIGNKKPYLFKVREGTFLKSFVVFWMMMLTMMLYLAFVVFVVVTLGLETGQGIWSELTGLLLVIGFFVAIGVSRKLSHFWLQMPEYYVFKDGKVKNSKGKNVFSFDEVISMDTGAFKGTVLTLRDGQRLRFSPGAYYRFNKIPQTSISTTTPRGS